MPRRNNTFNRFEWQAPVGIEPAAPASIAQENRSSSAPPSPSIPGSQDIQNGSQQEDSLEDVGLLLYDTSLQESMADDDVLSSVAQIEVYDSIESPPHNAEADDYMMGNHELLSDNDSIELLYDHVRMDWLITTCLPPANVDQDAEDAGHDVQEVPRAFYTADLESDHEENNAGDDEDEAGEQYADDMDEAMSSQFPPPGLSSPAQHGTQGQAFNFDITASSQPFDENPDDSDDTDTDSIRRDAPSTRISPLTMAFGLWAEKTSISRTDYVHLREVILMAQAHREDDEEYMQLPLKLDTLKRQTRANVPLLRLLRKPIKVNLTKQPTLPRGSKPARDARTLVEKTTWHYWYDAIDLTRHILLASDLVRIMHFGMAEYVDNPLEFWQSSSWGSSALSTSGEYAYTMQHSIILPGDILRMAQPVEGFTKGRVVFVGIDRRTLSPTKDHVVLTMQPVVSHEHEALQSLSLECKEKELFLLDQTFEVTEDQILHHVDVEMRWSFHPHPDPDESVMSWDFDTTTFFIRYILKLTDNEVKRRAIRFMHPTRADIEIQCYGRANIEAFHHYDEGPQRLPCISMPYVLFVDDFGVHRNMYRALKAFYLTPANLPYYDRRKTMNSFTLTLGPHGASMDDIISNMQDDLITLAKGIEMDIGNDTLALVRGFILVITGDMPQAADNSGFSRHNAGRPCRACLCTIAERSQLDKDIPGRFHWDVMLTREEGQDIHNTAERNRFFKNLGMKEDSPPIARISPHLDLILGRGYDIPHSEWRGIGRSIMTLLLQDILTAAGVEAFTRTLQAFPFPYDWPHIQSPAHFMQWSLSEHGRVLILLPLILRTHSRATWFKLKFIQAIDNRLDDEMFEGVTVASQGLIILFRDIAWSMSATGTVNTAFVHAEFGHAMFLQVRKAFMMLVDCVEAANSKKRAPSPASPSSPPPVSDSPDIPSSSDALTSSDADSSLGGIDDLEDDASIAHSNPDDDVSPRASNSRYDKLRRLPNVHVGLHLADNIREYAFAMNLNVLAGENFHSIWKGYADDAAPPQLMAYLFAKDNIAHSLRLGIAGAWKRSMPELAQHVANIERACPQLMDSWVPPAERRHDVRYAQSNATSCGRFSSVYFDVVGFVLSAPNDFGVGGSSTLRRLTRAHRFVRGILEAFSRAYNIRSIISFHNRDKLRWYSRVSVVVRDARNGSNRIIIKVGDIMGRAGQEGFVYIDQLCVVAFNRRQYGFAVVHELQHCGRDYMLDMDIYTKAIPAILGLSELSPAHAYMVQVFGDLIDDAVPDGAYIECTWTADFL